MADPHGSFIWYELLTRDAEAAGAFYGEVVGWTNADSGLADRSYRILMADGAGIGGMMQLSGEMIEHGAKAVWLGYFGVDDVDTTIAAIRADGGTILMEPFDIPQVGRVAMFADRQGIPSYVMRGAVDGTSGAFSPTTPRHCSWNELRTSDQADALAFYVRHFNWVAGDTMDMGPMGTYQFVGIGGVTHGAVMTRPPDGPPPGWNYYMRVADIDAAIARAGAWRDSRQRADGSAGRRLCRERHRSGRSPLFAGWSTKIRGGVMENETPKSLRLIALGLLAWNLIGVVAFISQWRMDAHAIAELPHTQQFLWAHMTARVWIAYATAVTAGTLTALMLVSRRKAAYPLAAFSLIAVIVQFTNPALLQVAADEGFGIMAFPLVIVAVCAVQLWLAMRWRAKGWLA